jgi:hypothetical protein
MLLFLPHTPPYRRPAADDLEDEMPRVFMGGAYFTVLEAKGTLTKCRTTAEFWNRVTLLEQSCLNNLHLQRCRQLLQWGSGLRLTRPLVCRSDRQSQHFSDAGDRLPHALLPSLTLPQLGHGQRL